MSETHAIHGRVKGVAFAPGKMDGECSLEVVTAAGHSDVITLIPGESESRISIDGVDVQGGGISPAAGMDVLAALAYWLAHHEATVTARVKTEDGILVALRAEFGHAQKG